MMSFTKEIALEDTLHKLHCKPDDLTGSFRQQQIRNIKWCMLILNFQSHDAH